jgi:formylglycine-generating enzyme required for sulfatase activity
MREANMRRSRVVVSKSVLRKAVLGLWPGPLRAFLIAGTMVATSFGSAASPAGSGQPPVLGEVFRDCAECPEMVVVPPGSFVMGSPETEPGRDPEEGPQRTVTFDASFAIGRYEVTYDDWDACLRGKGCDGYLPDDQGWGFGKRPVIRVSFHDAQHYVAWLRRRTGRDYRLPSEAEWEYAARAGTTTPFWTGERLDSNQANFHEHSRSAEAASRKGRYRGMTVEVDEPPFKPNAFGLFHTAGNVWEWVEDCFSASYLGAPTDGTAWIRADCANRVLRGGSWSEGPRSQRSAARFIGTPDMQLDSFGFRVARKLGP